MFDRRRAVLIRSVAYIQMVSDDWCGNLII